MQLFQYFLGTAEGINTFMKNDVKLHACKLVQALLTVLAKILALVSKLYFDLSQTCAQNYFLCIQFCKNYQCES